jgi:hypothetical protein
MRIDSQVSTDVPYLMLDTFRLTAGNVFEDQVIELMLEYALDLILWQAGKELRVVNHLKLSSVRTNPNTSSWDAAILTLLDLTAKSSKERLVHKKSVSVEFQIKAHIISLPYTSILPHCGVESSVFVFICP